MKLRRGKEDEVYLKVVKIHEYRLSLSTVAPSFSLFMKWLFPEPVLPMRRTMLVKPLWSCGRDWAVIFAIESEICRLGNDEHSILGGFGSARRKLKGLNYAPILWIEIIEREKVAGAEYLRRGKADMWARFKSGHVASASLR